MSSETQEALAASAVQIWTPESALEHAKNLAKATMAKEHFRNNPNNVLFAMELGRSFGLEPAVAIQQIHVFNSSEGLRTAISADLMIHAARSAGHLVHLKSTKNRVTAKLVRGDFTPERVRSLLDLGMELEEIREMAVFEETWTDERALEAGLLDKQNWKKYQEDMLRSRAKSGVVRMGASECLMGVEYTPDELGMETDRYGNPIAGAVASGTTVRDHRRATAARPTVTVTQIREPAVKAAPAPEPEVVDVEEAVEVVEETAGDAPAIDPQSVIDYALTVVNDESQPVMERIKTIHGLVTKVGENSMNDFEVTIGDDEPTGLEAALNELAKHLLKKKRAEDMAAKKAA